MYLINEVRWGNSSGSFAITLSKLVNFGLLRARSSGAERPAHNRLGVGSNPTEPTNQFPQKGKNRLELIDIMLFMSI